MSRVTVDLTDSLPDQLRVELRAQCGTSGMVGVFVATCSATVDPTFSIPVDFPGFALARLEFSPNLAPLAAVPEPRTVSLSLLALVGLVVGERIRVARRRRGEIASGASFVVGWPRWHGWVRSRCSS